MTTTQGATEQERNIVHRMAAIMGEIGAVGKTQRNADQNYMFRGIDAFMNALHPALVKHEVVITPRVVDRQSAERDRFNRQGQLVGVTRVVEMLVEFTFHSPDGTTLTCIAAGEGADVSDKATNKAMAGALKYAIMQTFMVPTQEMRDSDADRETIEVPSGSARAQRENSALDEAARAAAELGRVAIRAELDTSSKALGKSVAEVTKKWRDANGVGAVKELDDAVKVPDVELYRFVMQLRPYVAAAEARAAAEAAALIEPETPEPTAEERAAVATTAATQAICGAVREHEGRSQRCTSMPHAADVDHAWW